jgi:hypothetical protein
MKKEDVPQDLSSLGKITKEVCFVTDNSGKYITELSKGWEVKITANDVAWEDIQHRVEAARQKVLSGEASPLLFFMELRLMDPAIVAGYTGFWQWQIKRHLKPGPFSRLSQKDLQRYADTFNVSVEDIKTLTINGD